MNSFMNSDGCRLNAPSRTQRVLPLTCVPRPGTSTNTNMPMPRNSRYGPAFSHQRMRVRITSAMHINPSPTDSRWRNR